MTYPGAKVTPEQWAAVDWRRNNRDIGSELGVSYQRVGQKRAKLAPHTMQASRRAPAEPARLCVKCGKALERKTRQSGKLETLDQFRARQSCGGACKGAAIAGKLRGRARRAPEPEAGAQPPAAHDARSDTGVHVVTLEPGARVEIRAAPTSDNAIEVAAELQRAQQDLDAARSRSESLHRELLDARADLTRTQETLGHTARDLRTAKERLDAARQATIARADTKTTKRLQHQVELLTTERDRLKRDLQEAQRELATQAATRHAPPAGSLQAELDITRAELHRRNTTDRLRPELLHAITTAINGHPELQEHLAGTAATDSWTPSSQEERHA